MQEPDRTRAGEQVPSGTRRRGIRAAFLRPGELLVLITGIVFFAFTLIWWVIPLTLATYGIVVLLAAREPLLESRSLEGDKRRPETQPGSLRDISPERRAHWLPRGETRQKVEAALGVYRQTVLAIEESDAVVRAVLDDAVPKLHHAAERLVDIAEKREKAAEVIRDLKTLNASHTVSSSSVERHEESQSDDLENLKEELRAADAEISDTFEKLLALRARVARVSIKSGGAAQGAAAKLNADLDELNLRLEALRSTMSPPELSDR